MLVTNKKNVVRKMNFLLLILALIFFSTVVGFVLKSVIKYNLRLPLLVLGIILIITILNWIRNLRIFQFEIIGSTVSIKYYHPFKRGVIFPYLEFPITDMIRFRIEKTNLKSDLLKIDLLIEEKTRIVKIKLKISNLGHNAYQEMENSLRPKY